MRQTLVRFAAFAALAFAAPTAAFAQIAPVDPDTGSAWQPEDAPGQDEWQPVETPQSEPQYEPQTRYPSQGEWAPIEAPVEARTPAQGSAVPGFSGEMTTPATTQASATVPREDIFSAAVGVFGSGAEGLAGIIEDILKDQGEPIAYIAGEEASGAFILGARWGSGVMRHRLDGDRTVYWRGPSVGFDVGADASKVFILVYNMRDSQQIFRRYVGGEGRAYFVGGFTATYLRRGDVVLIPIRLGVGVRLGVNANYLRFSERNRWLPF